MDGDNLRPIDTIKPQPGNSTAPGSGTVISK